MELVRILTALLLVGRVAEIVHEGITEVMRFTRINVSGVQRRSAVPTAVDARMSRASGAMTRRRGMSVLLEFFVRQRIIRLPVMAASEWWRSLKRTWAGKLISPVRRLMWQPPDGRRGEQRR
jgi:hypothetical protein